MATTFSSSRVSTSTNLLTSAPVLGAVDQIWDHSEYTFGAAPVVNDVVRSIPVVAGARVLEVILSSTDLDTDATPAIVLAVGDGSDEDRFITASTAGQGGGVERLNNIAGHGYEYTADDTIDIKVTTAPDTGVVGTVKVSVLLDFSGV